jgi:hypothetical protein
MRVDVYKLPIPRGKLRNDGIHPIEIGPGNTRIDAQKITGIVAEGWIENCSEENRPHRKRIQESIEPLLEALHPFPAVCGQAAEKIIAAHCYQRNRWAGNLESS